MTTSIAGQCEVVVVVPDPAPAWVAAVVAGLKETLSRAHLTVAVSSQTSMRARRVVRFSGAARAGEANPEAAAAIDLPTVPWDSALITPDVDLVVDLTGVCGYRASTPADAPLLSLRFGAGNGAVVPSVFFDALIGRPAAGEIEVIAQDSVASRTVERVPVLLDRTSWSRTRHATLWRAAVALPRAAARTLTSAAAPAGGAKPRRGRRSVVRDGVVRGTLAARSAGGAVARVATREVWDVAIQRTTAGIPSERDLAAAATSWVGARHEVADPCLISLEGKTYLFAERLRRGAPGCICVGVVGPDGRVEELEDVLVRPYHLSYPQVFEDGGSVWMIPETGAAERVGLYVAAEFPQRWKIAATLLDGICAFDATLHRNSDGYWLWAAVARHGNHRNAELWLFISDALEGPWRAHPANPIVTDPRRARPAGPLFEVDGRLLRPAQDGLVRYGHKIVLNEVRALSRTTYHEVEVAEIGPGWARGLIATHTFSRAGEWQALDGCRRRAVTASRGGSRR